MVAGEAAAAAAVSFHKQFLCSLPRENPEKLTIRRGRFGKLCIAVFLKNPCYAPVFINVCYHT